VGVEDFPRDARARDFFRQALAPLLDSPRLGILIDLGHMHFWLNSRPCYRGVTPKQYIAGVPLRIREVHVHDNDGTSDAHRPLGEGTMDIAAVARALRAVGFDGVCTVEVVEGERGSAPDVAQMADTMRRMKAALVAT
jgi:sugar phosphate isomerase/epimerase